MRALRFDLAPCFHGLGGVLTLCVKSGSVLTTILLLLLSGCNRSDTVATQPVDPQPAPAPALPEYARVVKLGGDTTIADGSDSGHGFSTPAPGLTPQELELHLTGDAHFETSFTTAPNAAHPELDGLGPVFNNQDCNSCHQRDGRPSTLTLAADQSQLLLGPEAGIFLRVSLADDLCTNTDAVPALDNGYCRNTPVPGFGDQLFHRGVLKARPDWEQLPFTGQAQVSLTYQTSEFVYPDGRKVTLKKPLFRVVNPYDTIGGNPDASALAGADVRFSPRNGLPVFGLGLLELIPESQILALADPDDANGDGISGRANWVFDPVKHKNGNPSPVSLGRFGWKANTPSVRVQSLGALRGDMGVTNPLFPDESIAGTLLHDSYLARTGYVDTGKGSQGEPEASQAFSDELVFYTQTLAVPARRMVSDPQVLGGAGVFQQLGCAGCHTPSFTTGTSDFAGGQRAPAVLKGQKIYPFTDMLLHDMGPELADHRRDFLANGREWKTRPLWGIGLTKTVNPAAGFLHDGRAATLEEAILWHGGEAESSRQAFAQLPQAEREQLLAFLSSL